MGDNVPYLSRVWSTNVVMAEELRLRARQVEPPFCLEMLLAEASPGAIVVGRDLPDGVDEIVVVTAEGAVIVHRCDVDQRFACAHAIAHLLLDIDEGHLRPGPMFDDARELRADELALEILAPDRLLQPCIVFWPSGSADIYDDQVDKIAARFGVPRAMIDQRIRQLERTTNL